MSYIKKILLGVYLVLDTPILAQENLTGFWQPHAAINYDVTPIYGHNFSIAYRSFFFDNEKFNINGRQLDLVHFSKISMKDNQSIALGIQYRFREIFDGGPNELRLTQQFNITYRPLAVRYGHRLRTEQRITNFQTIHRFRYRFAADFALKGEKLDLGEPFFVGSLEQLLSVSRNQSPQYDVRLNGQIGWLLDKGLKFQMGVEYRFEDYIAKRVENVVFLLTSIQLSL